MEGSIWLTSRTPRSNAVRDLAFRSLMVVLPEQLGSGALVSKSFGVDRVVRTFGSKSMSWI